MSERRAQDYLNDIIEAMEYIQVYLSGFGRDEFMQDRKTIDAVVRNLEIIGEATKCLPSSLRDRHPQIPWKSLAGVRDKMIHNYFGLNYDIIWTIASDQLPGLLPVVREVAEKIGE